MDSISPRKKHSFSLELVGKLRFCKGGKFGDGHCERAEADDEGDQLDRQEPGATLRRVQGKVPR